MGLYHSPHVARRAIVLFVLLASMLFVTSCAITLPPNFTITETTSTNLTPPGLGSGFGDRQNSYAWSMAWFNGKLYVGTARNELCLEGITQDFFFPGKNYYQTNPGIGVTCPADKYDLDLRAEIWQYDPTISNQAQAWQRVYQSPADIPNPREAGKFVAEDAGFRGMVVYTDPSDPTSTPALYVGGITSDEYIPELQATHPPRILRTTDGKAFTPINGAPGQVTYDVGNGPSTVYPMGYRAMMVYNNRLFVTASPDLTGDGPVIEITNASSANPTFKQVSPPNLNAYELQSFNNRLYVGAGSTKYGYAIWRTDATGNAPYTFTPIVTGGAGRGPTVSAVVSMYPYQGRLYVGSSGWLNSLFPASELIRVNPDDTWQLVVGNSRTVSGETSARNPISGLPDGFGNPFNAHFWRMQDFENALYLGTNDWSWDMQLVPGLNTAFQSQFGFDIDGTCDGQNWYLITQNAFGDGQYNFGARSMATQPDQTSTYIGSANHATGTNVWRIRNTTPSMPACSSTSTTSPIASAASILPVAASSRVSSPTSSSGPTRLQVDTQSCATILSWDPVKSATQYRVLRSDFQLTDVTAPRPPQMRGPGVPDSPPPTNTAAGSIRGQVWAPGPAVQVATTSQPYFLDRTAKSGGHYGYVVEAVNPQGNASASNVVLVPSLAPSATFDSVAAAIADDAGRGKIGDGGNGLRALLDQAKSAAANGDQAGALKALGALDALVLTNPGRNVDPLAAQDLESGVTKLLRQVSLAKVSCDGGANVGFGGGRAR